MRKIDGKFSTDGEKIFNTVSGEPIQDDEPLFLLRARDRNAIPLLEAYYVMAKNDGCNDLHLQGIGQVLQRFVRFKHEQPERMKQPGITRHLKLENEL